MYDQPTAALDALKNVVLILELAAEQGLPQPNSIGVTRWTGTEQAHCILDHPDDVAVWARWFDHGATPTVKHEADISGGAWFTEYRDEMFDQPIRFLAVTYGDITAAPVLSEVTA